MMASSSDAHESYFRMDCGMSKNASDDRKYVGRVRIILIFVIDH